MYIRLEQLAGELAKRVSVQTFHVSDQIVTDICMFPLDFDQSTQTLSRDVCYICDYRKLRFLDPHIRLAPIICVVEPGAMVHGVFFSNRTAITVTGVTVSELMIMLTRITYELGGRSSPVTESAHELMNCRGIQEKMEYAFRLLGNPLLLTDRDQAVVAHADNGEYPELSYGEPFSEQFFAVGHPYIQAIDGEKAECEHPYISQVEDETMPVMVKVIRYRGQVEGHLQLLQLNRPFAEEDGPIMDMLGSLLAIDLHERPRPSRAGGHLRRKEHFLQEVLNNACDPEYIEHGAREAGLSVGDELYVIVVNAVGPNAQPIRPYYDMARQMAQELTNCLGFLFRGSIVLFLQADGTAADLDVRLAPLLPLMEKYGLAAGISSRFSSIGSIRPAAFQAVKALKLGSVLHEGKRLYRYTDYALYYAAELCLRESDISDFCPPEINIMIEQSDRDEGVLLNTLRCYIRNGRSKTLTAQELYIHVNTVKYRLQQIQNLYGLDLDDDDNALKVMLSFKMLEYREKFPAYEPIDIRNIGL